jgi:hypothetical protein
MFQSANLNAAVVTIAITDRGISDSQIAVDTGYSLATRRPNLHTGVDHVL